MCRVCAMSDARVLDIRSSHRQEIFEGEALVYPRVLLPPAWRMLLFGDGSPTRLLSLLTGAPLVVSVIGMEALGGDAGLEALLPAAAVEEARAVAAPRVQRRVWLETPSGQRLGYASSWWNQGDLEALLPNVAEPIGSALAVKRREIHRELLCVVHAVGHPGLEQALGLPRTAGSERDLEALPAGQDWGQSELWGRWYVMRQGGRPLCIIHEVFCVNALERCVA